MVLFVIKIMFVLVVGCWNLFLLLFMFLMCLVSWFGRLVFMCIVVVIDCSNGGDGVKKFFCLKLFLVLCFRLYLMILCFVLLDGMLMMMLLRWRFFFRMIFLFWLVMLFLMLMSRIVLIFGNVCRRFVEVLFVVVLFVVFGK